MPVGNDELLRLTAKIVKAYAGGDLPAAALPQVIADTFRALKAQTEPPAKPEPLQPAVPVKLSITPDYIVCLEDGTQHKILRRHLRVLGMTPDQYRLKWGLPDTYPMTAPNYAAQRSTLARKAGLGQHGRRKA